MVAKKIGISRDLIIHPGETIADVLEERGISQVELASWTGVTPAYISNVIAGKKDISAKFAFALEYALDIPKSFWLNLQANYDAELLEANENQTIDEEERTAREALGDIVKHLRKKGKMPERESKDDSILSLRKILQISNISNLKDLVPQGAFRMANAVVNPYVLGAWLRLCQLASDKRNITTHFDINDVDRLIADIKGIMLRPNADIQNELRTVMEKYGIVFSVVRNFKGAPVQGYISQKTDGSYQIALTIRGAFADIFWFSLFHELGHLVNGDLGKNNRFIDSGSDQEKEAKADEFASNRLINPKEYEDFKQIGDYSITSINRFAEKQRVPNYIVIGRLQKEKILDYTQYSGYKTRYKWAE